MLDVNVFINVMYESLWEVSAKIHSKVKEFHPFVNNLVCWT